MNLIGLRGGRLAGVAALGMMLAQAHAAFVNLTLYNSFALLDSDQSTPLSGSASSGDMVQLILVGANGHIDTPGDTGSPTGDDSLLPTTLPTNPTHVGAGLPGSNQGLLYQINLLYNSTYAGRSAYIRFWNGGQPWTSTYYGQTAIFTLPSGDAFGEAEYDFVPLAGSARATLTAFAADNPNVIPEPRLYAFGAVVLCAIQRLRARGAGGRAREA